MALAIGCGLALSGYALSQYLDYKPGIGAGVIDSTPLSPDQIVVNSIASKHKKSKAVLDALEGARRREEAVQLDEITDEEVDAILRAKENSWCVNSKSTGIRLFISTSQISSNNPTEDYLAYANLAVGQETSDSSDSGLYMFGVFDGHGGYKCAEYLAKNVGPTLEAVLSKADLLKANADKNWNVISLAISAAFSKMDYDAVLAPIDSCRRVIAERQDLQNLHELIQNGIAGSCGLVAVVDTNAKEVVVGNTGDSRALIGARQDDGTWKAIRLSEDQTAANPEEHARILSEHPGEETAILHGRILGRLMPTRAFGGSKYKWPLDAQKEIFPFLYYLGYSRAKTPRHCISPPYVTAQPIVTKHKLESNDKFLVLASDGLYDNLSDDEVVGAVAQWYEAHHNKSEATGTFTIKDSNAATHLIRAALSIDWHGSQGDKTARRLLAIPSPHSRDFHDDISVTVVTLNAE
ncbi:[Pyruvate dehydrogenase [acetyl-transferring]]-phosphatase 1, mitochondrial [Coemansia sp. BCRC 34301]|nr:[Pyruvate dehydrogenase [acetyl-transferring]]-phosphatase 1, mitochondrial [Coemansia sp. BCRC 34301]